MPRKKPKYPMPPNKNFNNRLNTKIVEKFITKKRFAAKMKIQDSKVSRVIYGMRLPEEEKVVWAYVLGCSVGDIFGD